MQTVLPTDPGAEDTCSRECARVIQPFWQDCGPLLMQMHMDGTEGMEAFDEKCAARPTCDFSLLFEHMMNMDQICCSERGSDAAWNFCEAFCRAYFNI